MPLAQSCGIDFTDLHFMGLREMELPQIEPRIWTWIHLGINHETGSEEMDQRVPVLTQEWGPKFEFPEPLEQPDM